MSNWKSLNAIEDIQALDEVSQLKPCLIYKHSSRCSISSMAKNRLENGWTVDPVIVPAYYLDLITFRAVSNHIESHYGIRHESPQVLLIYKGKCIYHQSHMGIVATEIAQIADETIAKSA